MEQNVPSKELQHKAVAYAVLHKNEMPDGIKQFIEDLYGYEETGKRLEEVRNQTRASLRQIEEQMTQLYGSMDAVIKIIARELGNEKVIELGTKYQIPENLTDLDKPSKPQE